MTTIALECAPMTRATMPDAQALLGRFLGACVVCRAISTSRGAVVAKLDDVTVHPDWLSRGVGGRMLAALLTHLRAEGIARVDSGCHRDNTGAWRFYERLGFVALDEERIALVL